MRITFTIVLDRNSPAGEKTIEHRLRDMVQAVLKNHPELYQMVSAKAETEIVEVIKKLEVSL